MDDRPRYMISVAADLVGMHPQTLRIYENKGLIRPKRTAGNTRLYSEHDLDRLRLIQRLTNELGLNLAGVEHVLRLQDELVHMRRRLDRMEREMRSAINEVHRQYRRDLVPWKPPVDLMPKHRHGLQQADTQIAGSRLRGAGARAPDGPPGALPGASAARAARPGAAAAARPGRRRAARASRGGAARQAVRAGNAATAERVGRVLARARQGGRRGAPHGGRLRVDGAPATRARRRAPRAARGEDQVGARWAARDVAGPGRDVPGTGEG